MTKAAPNFSYYSTFIFDPQVNGPIQWARVLRRRAPYFTRLCAMTPSHLCHDGPIHVTSQGW